MLKIIDLFIASVCLCCVFSAHKVPAQNVLTNGVIAQGGSDNAGSGKQTGLEVMKSIPKIGITFDTNGTFEHVGQFYVAQDGIWNSNNVGSTDYFGYAPIGIGSNLPYQGIGIRGASDNNGGRGASTPTFGNLELNSTGIFPLAAGMRIISSLVFNAHGPGGSNIIATPLINVPDSPINTVIFEPTSHVTGSNSTNYIDGYASVTNTIGPFTLPLGDAQSPSAPLHTLTIDSAVSGTVTARYLYSNQRPITSFGKGISWVSPVGSWLLSAPKGAVVTVDMPALPLTHADALYLRLVGWNGHQWVNLSETATPGACITGNCPLRGTLSDGISDLAIGLSKEPTNIASLLVWPSPTQGPLHLSVPADKVTNEIRVFDQQGRVQLDIPKHTLSSSLDVSVLPAGIYLLEVHTTEGQTLRQRFIRQ